MSDALAGNMNSKKDNQNTEHFPKMSETAAVPKQKIAKKEPSSTIVRQQVDIPTGNAITPQDEPAENQQIVELFPTFDSNDDIPDDDILNILTQIEQENKHLPVTSGQMKSKNQNKTINVTNVSSIANVNRHPLMPTMYFPNSNVTINYHFSK